MYRLLLLPLSLSAFVFAAGRCHGSPLLEAAVNGYQQTLEQIASLQTSMRLDLLARGKSVGTRHVDWWQRGNSIRWREKADVRSETINEPGKSLRLREELDILFLENKATVVHSNQLEGRKETEQARIGNMTLSEAGGANVWSRAAFLILDDPELWLKDVLKDSAWRPKAQRTELDGRTMILVEGQNPKLTAEKEWEAGFRAWIDPAHGYLAKKLVVYHYADDFDVRKPYSEFEVVKFHPPYKDTGISFPAEVAIRFYTDPKRTDPGRSPDYENRVTFHSVKINEPIADDVFRLSIPVGYKVVDRITGQYYTMGAGGKPVAPQPLLSLPPEPRQEPLSWVLWLWAGSGIIFLATLTYVLVKKLRARTA